MITYAIVKPNGDKVKEFNDRDYARNYLRAIWAKNQGEGYTIKLIYREDATRLYMRRYKDGFK